LSIAALGSSGHFFDAAAEMALIVEEWEELEAG
jgi:hypothetical protein